MCGLIGGYYTVALIDGEAMRMLVIDGAAGAYVERRWWCWRQADCQFIYHGVYGTTSTRMM
jgi:hypothetical protein